MFLIINKPIKIIIAALLNVKNIAKTPKTVRNEELTKFEINLGLYKSLRKKKVVKQYAKGRVEAKGPIDDLYPSRMKPS